MTTNRKRQAAASRTQRAHEEMSTRKLAAVGVVFMLFGGVSLLTSAFFLLGAGRRQYTALPAEGGVIDPIVVEARHTVLQVSVSQTLKQEGWSYIEGELRDQAQGVLFGFGGELWRESGVDSDGAWSESEREYVLRITVPEPGTYYLAFEAETGHVGMMNTVPASEMAGAMMIMVQPLKGSPVPFRTAGLLALLIGFLLHEVATGAFFRFLASLES